MRASSY